MNDRFAREARQFAVLSHELGVGLDLMKQMKAKVRQLEQSLLSHMARYEIKKVRLKTGGMLTRNVRRRRAHVTKANTIQCCLDHAHGQKLDQLQSALENLSKSQAVEKQHLKYTP